MRINGFTTTIAAALFLAADVISAQSPQSQLQSALSNLRVIMEKDNVDGYYDNLIARFSDLEAKVAAGNFASIEAQVNKLNSDLEKAMGQSK